MENFNIRCWKYLVLHNRIYFLLTMFLASTANFEEVYENSEFFFKHSTWIFDENKKCVFHRKNVLYKKYTNKINVEFWNRIVFGSLFFCKETSKSDVATYERWPEYNVGSSMCACYAHRKVKNSKTKYTAIIQAKHKCKALFSRRYSNIDSEDHSNGFFAVYLEMFGLLRFGAQLMGLVTWRAFVRVCVCVCVDGNSHTINRYVCHCVQAHGQFCIINCHNAPCPQTNV